MCPPLSCCHRSRACAASVPAYHLARLVLARGGDELLPDEGPLLEARAAGLWQRLRCWLQQRYGVPAVRALMLAQQLVARLLGRDCCRRALRHAVPLAEALGPQSQLSDPVTYGY